MTTNTIFNDLASSPRDELLDVGRMNRRRGGR